MVLLLRGCKATERRDKVFGLLGLCRAFERGQSYGIEENCNLNDREVYISAAKSILEGKRNLDLFAALRFQPGTKSSEDLPSWVPDVRISPKRIFLRLVVIYS